MGLSDLTIALRAPITVVSSRARAPGRVGQCIWRDNWFVKNLYAQRFVSGELHELNVFQILSYVPRRLPKISMCKRGVKP